MDQKNITGQWLLQKYCQCSDCQKKLLLDTNLEKHVKIDLESCYGSVSTCLLSALVKAHAASSSQGCFAHHIKKLCHI